VAYQPSSDTVTIIPTTAVDRKPTLTASRSRSTTKASLPYRQCSLSTTSTICTPSSISGPRKSRTVCAPCDNGDRQVSGQPFKRLFGHVVTRPDTQRGLLHRLWLSGAQTGWAPMMGWRRYMSFTAASTSFWSTGGTVRSSAPALAGLCSAPVSKCCSMIWPAPISIPRRWTHEIVVDCNDGAIQKESGWPETAALAGSRQAVIVL
jgi:hypothetical protein